MQVYVCGVGFEAALLEELGAGTVVVPGVVKLLDDRPLAETDLVFARQVLPAAHAIVGASANALARGALDALLPGLDGGDAPLAVSAFALEDPADPVRGRGPLGARAALVGERFLAELKARRRRHHRRVVPAPAGAAVAVELLLVERERLFASLARVEPCLGGGRWPSPLPGGLAAVVDDRLAPSRAYKKLEEALAWLERDVRPGERAVDLGAAPGSWAWALVRRGAEVVAVDRAPLDGRLAGRVEIVAGDAFRYEPPRPVDWLFSDVIATPERILELLARWLSARWCRGFVVHLKFKGDERLPAIRAARALAESAGYPGARVKHLAYDKNEVTVMRSPDAPMRT